VRTLKIVVAVLLVVAGLAGCSLFGHDEPTKEDQLQKVLDDNAQFTVFLRDDATEAQRKDVEAALRALPGVTEVSFENHDEAYRRMTELFSADPTFVAGVEPEALPESFKVKATDVAAIRKIRDEGTVSKLPGVNKPVFTCLDVEECKRMYSPRPSGSPA
jgi:cell division transport system permease protein